MTSATSHRNYRLCHGFVSLLPLWGMWKWLVSARYNSLKRATWKLFDVMMVVVLFRGKNQLRLAAQWEKEASVRMRLHSPIRSWTQQPVHTNTHTRTRTRTHAHTTSV